MAKKLDIHLSEQLKRKCYRKTYVPKPKTTGLFLWLSHKRLVFFYSVLLFERKETLV